MDLELPGIDVEVGDSGPERYVKDVSLPYAPFPRQRIFHNDPAPYRLFGGAAGPGKSHALLMEAIHQAAIYYPDSPVETLLLRRTYEELDRSILQKFRTEVPRELYRSYNDSKHIVTWHSGAVTRFGYCKLEKDVWQYQGAEFIFIGWDELTQFTLSQWQTLKGWNRSKYGRATMAGATNPVGVGLQWVKALWIDKKPAPGMDENEAAQYHPEDYSFTPALLSDNPIYATDEVYQQKLREMPTHLREALLGGRWDILAGVYFDIFDRAVMTMRPEEMGLKDWHARWISIDWGFEHPAAVYWHAQAGDVTMTYREYEVQHQGPVALAQTVRELSGKENIDAIYLSPDAFAKRTDADTIAQQMNSVFREKNPTSGTSFPPPHHADNDRVGGWMLMYQLLKASKWFIGTNCPRLIEVLPSLVRDEKNVEDIAKVDGDDPADAARYGLKTRLGARRPPLEERVAARVTAKDPTAVAIQVAKLTAEERKKGRPFVPMSRRRGPKQFR